MQKQTNKKRGERERDKKGERGEEKWKRGRESAGERGRKEKGEVVRTEETNRTTEPRDGINFGKALKLPCTCVSWKR